MSTKTVRKTRTCQICTTSFRGRSDAKTCSPACRKRLQRYLKTQADTRAERLESALGEGFHKIAAALLKQHVLSEPLVLADERGSIAVAEPPTEDKTVQEEQEGTLDIAHSEQADTTPTPAAQLQSTALPREADKRFIPQLTDPGQAVADTAQASSDGGEKVAVKVQPASPPEPESLESAPAAAEPVTPAAAPPAATSAPSAVHLEDMMSTESLEPSAGGVGEAMQAAEEDSKPPSTTSIGGRFSLFRYNRIALMSTGLALLAIVLISVSSFFLLSKHNNKQVASGNSPSSYAVGNLPLGNVRANQSLQVGEANQLTINGQLTVNKTLVLEPSSTPSSPVTGQIYYDKTTNAPYYYDGSQFISLAPQSIPQHVSSIGGSTGAIGLGNGLSVVNNQLNVAFAAGNGISINGSTISNSGVVGLQGGSNIAITNNGGGIYTVSSVGGTGVTSLTGTANQINVSGSTGAVTLSLPQDIAVSSSPTFGGLTVNGTLSVATLQQTTPGNNLNISAGSDNISFTAGGRTFIFPTSGPASQTICTTGITCASGGGQAVLLQPGTAQTDTGSGPSVFFNNTGGGGLLELQSGGTDRFVVNNTGNVTTAGTYNGQTISSAANFTGTVAIQGSNSLSLGTSSNIGSISFHDGSSANTGTLKLGGPLSAGATYNLPVATGSQTICTVELGNCAGSGSGVTTLGGTVGTIALFSGSQSIANSILTQSGSTLTATGNLVLNTANGFVGNLINLEVNTSSKLTVDQAGNSIQAGTLTVNGTGASSIAGTLAVGTGLTVTTGGANITGTTSVTGNASITGTLAVQGANALTLGTASTTTGAIVFKGSGGNGTLTLQGPTTPDVGNYTLSIPTISTNDTICTNSTRASACPNYAPASGSNNYIINSTSPQTADFNITGSGTAATFNATSAIQLGGANINTAGTLNNVAYLNQANTFTAAGTALTVNNNASIGGTLAVQGSGGLTLGVASTTAGSLKFANATNSNLGVLQAAAPTGTGNGTYTLPSLVGGTSDEVCLKTLGNCGGSGGGVTTPGGTAGHLAVFTGLNTIADSVIAESGSAVSVNGTLSVTGASSLTLGTASTNTGSVAFKNSTNGNTLTLQAGATASNLTLTLPTADGSNGYCLQTNGSGVLSFNSCTGGSAGGVTSLDGLAGVLTLANSSGVGSTITIDNASTAQKGIAQFNATNFTASSGTINTIQDIATTSSPTFANVTASGTLQGDIINATGVGAALQLNGVNINTGGTLSNVAYLDQANIFSQSQTISAAGGKTTLALSSTGANTGITLGGDTNLYRSAANVLKTDDNLEVQGYVQLATDNASKLFFGAAADTNLYRSAANVLKTDDNLEVQGYVQLALDNTSKLVFGSAGDTNLYRSAANTLKTDNNLVVAGGGLTVGVPGTTAGVINLSNATNSNLSVISASAPTGTGNATYSLPAIAGGSSDVICLVSLGNCAGSGGGITGSGTNGTIAIFTGTGSIGNSTLTQSGSTVTASGNMVIQGASSLTLGTASTNTGSVAFKNSTNGNTLTLQAGATASNLTLTLPTADGSNGYCLQTNGSGVLSFNSCTGGSAGGVTSLDGLAGVLTLANSSGVGSTITIDNASTAQKGIAQFNATNFTASSGTINTIQDIATTSSPTFGGLTLSSALTVPNGGTGAGSFAANGILYGNGTSALQATSAAANSVLVTDGSNVPSLSQTLPTAVQGNITTVGALTAGSIASGFGTISTGNNITTTATVQAGTGVLTGASSLTLGTASTNTGSVAFKNGTNNNTLTLQAGATASNLTLTLPTADGSNGNCLLTNGSGILSFGSCTGGAGGGVTSLDGQVGVLTLSNSSGSAGTITIDNASTAQKGIAQFNATNFSASSGTINTIQDIATTSSPVFVSPNATTGVNTGPGAGTQRIDASGNLVNIGTITTSGAINGQTISSSASFTGTLQVAGNITTTSGTIRGTGATSGSNALGARVSGDSVNRFNVQAGGTLQWGDGTNPLDTTLSRASAGVLQTGDSFTVAGSTLTVGTAGSITGSINLSNSTSTRQVILQGLNPTGTGNATIQFPSIAGGSTDTVCLATLSNCSAAGSAGGDLTGSYPNPTIAKLQGTTLTLSSFSSGDVLQYNGSAIVNGHITNSNLTAGNFGAIQGTGTLTSGAIGSGFGAISTGSNISTTAALHGDTLSAGTSNQFQVDASGNLTIANTASILGSNGLTLGNAGSTDGVLSFANSTNTNLTVLQAAAPSGTGNANISVPSIAGGSSDEVCLKTLQNCVGTGGGVTTPGGTPGALAYFSGSQTIADSIVSQSGTTLTVAGNQIINAGSGFSGNLLNLEVNTSSKLSVDQSGNSTQSGTLTVNGTGASSIAGSLSVSSTLTLSTLGTADTNSLLCRNSSNQIASCSGTGGGSPFVQGGNSFGAQAVLGTNDNNSLAFETNGNTVATLSTAGQLALSVQGSAGGLLIGGDATLYRSAANTLTAQTLNATTGINTGAGAGTQRIDASGNLVAIGNITGSSAVAIAAGSTAQNISLDASTSGQILIGGTSTGDILLGGGSSSTGCTLTNSNGNLNCSGAITGSGYTASGTGATAAFAARKTAANIVLQNLLLAGDANPAFKIIGDGTLSWGTGGASAVDTSLARSAAGELTTNGNLVLQGGSLLTNQTTANLFNATATTLNIGGAVGAGGINLAGGSGSTGCTIDGSNGNLACSGNITGASTGTVGYWSRSGTTLQPATAGDAVTTSGNISTTGSGTISSAGLLTGSAGATISGAAINLNASSNFATNINTGTSTGAVAIGNTSASETVTIQGGTGSSALALSTGSGGTLSVGNSGLAGTIQIGNTTGAVAQTINIGNNATASSSTTLNIGSIIGASPTTIQGGSSGVTVKSSSTTAFQVQNAGGSATLFGVDSTNSVVSVLTNNTGETQAWNTNANSLTAATRKHSTVAANGYIYVLGGVNSGGSDQATTMYAKLNAGGSTGTWTNTTSLPAVRSSGTSVTVNGYVYYLGGSNTDTVMFAKLNTDGTIGSWKCQGTASPCGMTPVNNNSITGGATSTNFGVAFTANGYIYVVSGNGSTNATTYYAKVYADGTTGTWSTTSSLSVVRNLAGVAVANGYAYLVGGEDGVGAAMQTTFSAKINTDGTLGTWRCQGSNSTVCGTTPFNTTVLTPGIDAPVAQAANGYLYVIGGMNGGNSQNSVFYARLNSDGTVANYATSANSMPGSGTFWGATAMANGYIYTTGGTSGTSTVLSAVYYVSLSRISAAGSLDLLGTSGQDLLGGNNQAGSLTAGNTFIAGDLQVQGQVALNQSLSVRDNLTVGGSALFQNATNSTAAFQIQNSSGSNLLKADTTNNDLIIGANLVANGSATSTTATTSGTGTNTTTLTFTGTTSFANDDVIYIDNAGQDYYTRIVSGGNAASVTVSPAVTFENSRTVTKYNVQNIGSDTNAAPSSNNSRFFQGYFLGGVVTGAGSTTLSDNNLISTGSLTVNGATSTSLQVGASGTINVGTTVQTSTLNIGNTSASSTTLIQGGTGASAVSIQSGASGTISLGSSGVANTIQIGNTSGAVSQTINIGNNATASSSTTLVVGSTIGASPTTLQSGTSGTLVKGASSTTAFQIQNASSTSLFTADTTNTVLTLNTQNGGTTTAWATANSSGFSGRSAQATVTGNGYVYVIAGQTVTNNSSRNYFGTVQYAKINADGTLGNWSTTTALPGSAVLFGASAVYVNGYIYVMGGSSTNSRSDVVNTVYYGKVNADGTVSSWNTGTTLGTATMLAAAAYSKGYIYYVGGINSGNVSVGTVQYAKINGDGSLGNWGTTTATTVGTTNGGRDSHGLVISGNTMYVFGGEQNGNKKGDTLYNTVNNDGTLGASWTDQGGTNAMPSTRESFSYAATDGYIYVMGGDNGSTALTTFYYAPIPATGGQLGAWTDATSTNPLPNARSDGTGFTANGYIYYVGGEDTNVTSQSTIYVTSTGRIRIGGSLDLVGLTGQSLADGTTNSGTLTAGNTNIMGALQVQGAANFSQSVAISGTLTVGGDVAIKSTTNSATAFQIQSSGGTNLFTADTSSLIVTVAGTDSSYSTLKLTDNHIRFTQTTAPTAVKTSALGTTGSCSVSGTDSGGEITMVASGTGLSNGAWCTITFHTAYGSTPRIIFTGANAAGGNTDPYVLNQGTTSFQIGNTNNAVASTMLFDYIVFQN